MDVCTGNSSFSEAFVSCMTSPCFPPTIKQRSGCGSHQENVKFKIPMQDLNSSGGCSVKNEGLTPDHLRTALSDLDVEDFHGVPSEQDEDGTKHFEDHKESVLLQDTNLKKGLSKSTTFPLSRKVHASLEDGGEALSTLPSPSQSSSEPANPVLGRSTSLPVSFPFWSVFHAISRFRFRVLSFASFFLNYLGTCDEYT